MIIDINKLLFRIELWLTKPSKIISGADYIVGFSSTSTKEALIIPESEGMILNLRRVMKIPKSIRFHRKFFDKFPAKHITISGRAEDDLSKWIPSTRELKIVDLKPGTKLDGAYPCYDLVVGSRNDKCFNFGFQPTIYFKFPYRDGTPHRFMIYGDINFNMLKGIKFTDKDDLEIYQYCEGIGRIPKEITDTEEFKTFIKLVEEKDIRVMNLLEDLLGVILRYFPNSAIRLYIDHPSNLGKYFTRNGINGISINKEVSSKWIIQTI